MASTLKYTSATVLQLPQTDRVKSVLLRQTKPSGSFLLVIASPSQIGFS